MSTLRWTTDSHLTDMDFFHTLAVVPIKLSSPWHCTKLGLMIVQSMVRCCTLRTFGLTEKESSELRQQMSRKIMKLVPNSAQMCVTRSTDDDMKIGSAYKTPYSSASLIATVRAATSLSVFSVSKKWSRVPRVRGFHVRPMELCPTANPEVRFFDTGEAV